MFDRLRIAWQLCWLPRDVIHKLRLHEQVWDIDTAAVVTYWVRHHKIRRFPVCRHEAAQQGPMDGTHAN
jgi:hypothetical protein